MTKSMNHLIEFLRIGDHLVTPRGVYTHHGIYVGDGRVVHYSGFADLVNGLKSVVGSGIKYPVEEVTLEEFESGKGFSVKQHPNPLFTGDEVAQRARSRIGEDNYCVVRNNCEHFCEWCIHDENTSWQVRKVVDSGSSLAIAAAPYLARFSGVLGVAPSMAMAAANAVNQTVLKDDPSLNQNERDSLAWGRKASYAGAAVGTVGSLGAIGAAGSVGGLSAAGVSTGLAAIGGSVGGGVVTGVALTSIAPAAATVAIGYGVYKLVQFVKKEEKEEKGDKEEFFEKTT